MYFQVCVCVNLSLVPIFAPNATTTAVFILLFMKLSTLKILEQMGWHLFLTYHVLKRLWFKIVVIDSFALYISFIVFL